VVRAWSAALNTDDNAAAGRLFAPGALVTQGGAVYELRGAADAARWTASLPCSGHIVDVQVVQETVTAVFILGNRPQSRCDAPPGTRAAARFTIRSGKIVGWEQLPVPGAEESPET
jgi:limonene-1,2-epoxide hydrolase